jgi:hypothetical protein
MYTELTKSSESQKEHVRERATRIQIWQEDVGQITFGLVEWLCSTVSQQLEPSRWLALLGLHLQHLRRAQSRLGLKGKTWLSFKSVLVFRNSRRDRSQVR